MKLVFFGTPEYVLPILNSLNKTFKIKGVSPVVAVVTQKPKPSGRKKFLSYSAVDDWAHKRKIPIFFSADDLVKNAVEADIGILAAYGEIIPKNVINHFPRGILNIHPSLLPKYRGASPVQAAIVADEKQTGVSMIKMDEQLDHGPIVSQFKEDILPDDTTDSLRSRLFERSAEVLTTLIPAYLKGKITPRRQDESQLVFTRQIKKGDAFIPAQFLDSTLQGSTFKGKWKIPFIIDYSLVPSAHCLDRFIRSMFPWPIAWTYAKLTKNQSPKRLKIVKAHTEKLVPNASCLVPDLVQLEGKNEVSWQQFTSGYPQAQFSDS
jgi:methionyl-tRNA formyltransferase